MGAHWDAPGIVVLKAGCWQTPVLNFTTFLYEPIIPAMIARLVASWAVCTLLLLNAGVLALPPGQLIFFQNITSNFSLLTFLKQTVPLRQQRRRRTLPYN